MTVPPVLRDMKPQVPCAPPCAFREVRSKYTIFPEGCLYRLKENDIGRRILRVFPISVETRQGIRWDCSFMATREDKEPQGHELTSFTNGKIKLGSGCASPLRDGPNDSHWVPIDLFRRWRLQL
jgi:hypothetical protein